MSVGAAGAKCACGACAARCYEKDCPCMCHMRAEPGGMPKGKILLYALKRELMEREVHQLDDAVVRQLVRKLNREFALDF